jgi:Tfp pilus assembly protein PilF
VFRTVAALLCVCVLGACGSSSKSGNGPATTNPKSATALLNKALQEHVAGKLAEAKADYEAVIRLDPQNKFAFYNLGLIAQTQHGSVEAESNYQLALTIDPSYEPALYNLAIVRTAAGDATGALDLYERAIAASPKDAKAHFNLGLLLRKIGKVTQGNAQVAAAVKLDPSLASQATAQGFPPPTK